MPSNTPAPQAAAIATLERARFTFVCWFDAHDDNDGQCATYNAPRRGFHCTQCEVDPDGSVNGLEVSAFLARERK